MPLQSNEERPKLGSQGWPASVRAWVNSDGGDITC
jgi:hypothetical protein